MHFVITHKKIDWEIPFEHNLISVGSYNTINSINASSSLIQKLNLDDALGGLRSFPIIMDMLKEAGGNETVVVSSYRLFLTNIIDECGLGGADFCNRMLYLTPEELLKNHESLLLKCIPDEYDLVLATPIKFGGSILKQYSLVHHLDDLLNAVAIAVEVGLVDPTIAADVLSGNVLIPYGYFASRKDLRINIMNEFWDYAMKLYIKIGENKNRSFGQVRYIDFALERIFSIYIYQKIIRTGLRFCIVKPVFIDFNKVYVPS